jgi:ubiquinone/menaquinone biosynthesis C-methylase UbiE
MKSTEEIPVCPIGTEVNKEISRKPLSGDWSTALYNLGASFYDLITTQDYWKDSVLRLTRHFRIRHKNIRVLDLGCGAGISAFVLAEQFREAQIVGIDIATKMIERAQFHHRTKFAHLTNVELVEADATHLPFEEGTFDIAIGHSFLYLIPQKIEVLSEVERVLKKGGQLVLMEPYANGSLLRTLVQRTDYLQKLWKRPGPTLRFIVSMVAWRLFSFFKGQLSPECVHQAFSEAGFSQITTIPTLNQLGVYCIGEKQ